MTLISYHRVLQRQAQQTALHGLAGGHLWLIDVDQDQRVLSFLVNGTQELLPRGDVNHLFKAPTPAQLSPHFLHALQAVLLQEVVVILLIIFVHMKCHLTDEERNAFAGRSVYILLVYLCHSFS